ncbi:ribosome recycling factor [soil metagenome]
MDPNQAVTDAKAKFTQAVQRYQEDLKKMRTGRANAAMLDGIMVEAYGVAMPLNQVATISVPEPQLLQLTPFDPGNIQAIAAAIRNNQSLGMNPSDDGRVVRVPVPPLTEDRRRDMVKQVGQRQEDCMITLRNVRHDALTAIDAAKKAKDIGEDDAKRLAKQVDDDMNAARSNAEAATKSKEQEIMTV